MTTAALTADKSTSSASAGGIFKAALTGGAIAAVANLALYGVTRAAGVDYVANFDPAAGPAPLLPFLPAVSSLIPSLFAGLVMLGLSKATRHPAPIFIGLSVAFALLSLGGPLRLEASMGTKVALSLMHFVAAAAITVPLVRKVK
jgi:hypothetical protein